MTSYVTFEVQNAGGVDSRLIFPGLLPATPVDYRIDDGVRTELTYAVNGQTYGLHCDGATFSLAPYSRDVSGVATGMSLVRVDGAQSETELMDVTMALDPLLVTKYGGLPVNSLLGLTPDGLINLVRNDSLFELTFLGNVGNDRLYGSDYVDFLNGKAGRDRLTGYGGSDTFYFDAFGKADRDHVADFHHLTDKIAIDGNVLAGILPGNLARTFHDITADGMAAEDANDRLLYDRHAGLLYYDGDGNAAHGAKAQVVAVFDNHAHLDTQDLQIFL